VAYGAQDDAFLSEATNNIIFLSFLSIQNGNWNGERKQFGLRIGILFASFYKQSYILSFLPIQNGNWNGGEKTYLHTFRKLLQTIIYSLFLVNSEWKLERGEKTYLDSESDNLQTTLYFSLCMPIFLPNRIGNYVGERKLIGILFGVLDKQYYNSLFLAIRIGNMFLSRNR
jgi:hypothetical protein